MRNRLLLVCFCLMMLWGQGSLFCLATTVINTSFETADGYTLGNVKDTNKWTVSSGTAQITNISDYVYTGMQGLQLSASNTTLQTDHVAYAKNAIGLEGIVYVNFYIKLQSLPTSSLSVTCYDLGTNTHRSALLEFTSSGKIKIYNGSSGYSTQPVYKVGEWIRISLKINPFAQTYQIAINGNIINEKMKFREIKNGATDIDYHSIRFSMSSGTCNAAIDDIFIGNDALTDIDFGAEASYKTLSITQPTPANITVNPSMAKYEVGTSIQATCTLPDTYEFVSWSGDISGTSNPTTFTIHQDMTISANIKLKENPCTITLTQPDNGTISVSPNSLVHSKGTSVTFTANIPEPYEFISWTGDLSGNESPQTIVIQNNIQVGCSIKINDISGTNIRVTNATELKKVLKEQIMPGDTVWVADGEYNLSGVTITRTGAVEKPIVIMAENMLGAKIIGPSYFTLRKVTGLEFCGFDFDLEPTAVIFKLEGDNYIRITRNRFKMAKTSDTQTSKWILFTDIWDNDVCTSHHNRLDHNLFLDKFDGGAWVVIDGAHGTPDISKYDRIDHNIFRNNSPRAENEKETIRIGVSDLSMKSAYTTVEYNLFEDCDGDPEIISVKSCHNIIRYNTFRHCLGTLSLRHGNTNRAEGNYFFGDGKTAEYSGGTIGCGGIRVYGKDHVIVNNYMEGLTGSRWDPGLALTKGDVTNSSTSLSSHFLPENVLFAYNTLINNVSNIEIGFDNSGKYSKKPIHCTISNNIIVDSLHPIVKFYDTMTSTNILWNNNIFYPVGVGSVGISSYTENEVKTIDPKLIYSNLRSESQKNYTIGQHLYKLSNSSPAINNGNNDSIITDMEGQPLIGLRDIGADELNGNDKIISSVVTEEIAGPYAAETASFEKADIPNQLLIGKIHELSASQNPFQQKVCIFVPSAKTQNAFVNIVDITGKILLQDYIQLTNGLNSYYLQIRQTGILFINIITTEKTETIKLISK